MGTSSVWPIDLSLLSFGLHFTSDNAYPLTFMYPSLYLPVLEGTCSTLVLYLYWNYTGSSNPLKLNGKDSEALNSKTIKKTGSNGIL